jgi:hypothetical protein
MRCRAFYCVSFCGVLVKFVKSNAFFRYSPNGSYRSKKIGLRKIMVEYLSNHHGDFLLGTRPSYRVTKYRLSISGSETKLWSCLQIGTQI